MKPNSRRQTLARKRQARIVATLGPSSRDAANIARLFDAGADTFRLKSSA